MSAKRTSARSTLLPPAVLFLITIALLFTGFFELWRLICLIVTRDLATGVPATILAESFVEGLRFDFATASYLMLPIVALSLLPMIDIVRNRFTRIFIFVLISIVAAITFFGHLADIEFFHFFNARLNGTALLWQDSANLMVSMIWETYPVVRYLLLYGLLVVCFIYCLRAIQRTTILNKQPSRWWVNLIWLPVLLAAFALGARGRTETKSPMRWGVAYFSEYSYANQLALNPVYTFMRDVLVDAGNRKQVENLMSQIKFPEAETMTRDILNRHDNDTGRMYTAVHYDPPNENPPNVIVIIMESFGSSHIGVLNNQTHWNLSPRFDSLANEGTLFTNIYSSGMHTYVGLFSTLYGFPPGFGKLVVNSVPGYFHHWGLPQILKEHGYHTFFMCPHDPHFDNMQGLLMDNGVDEVHSLFDFDPKEKLTTFGVPDHVMFNKAVELLHPLAAKPFFATLLSCSFHGPWIIPDAPFEHIPDTAYDAKELNAFKYSDWSLGQFIRDLQADSVFDNTIVLVTADNGAEWKQTLDMDPSQYQIPILMYWIGKNKPAPRRIDVLGSQLDIVATVMGQVRLNWDNYTFGRDLFDSTITDRFALSSEWRKIAYREGSNFLIERMYDDKPSLFHLPDIKTNYAATDSATTASLTHKALALYQTGYFQMRKPLVHTTNHTAHPIATK